MPFEAETPLAVILKHLQAPLPPPSSIADVPPEIEAVILRCLNKDKSERYRDASELATALRRCRDGTSAVDVPRKPFWRRPVAVFSTMLFAVLAAGALAVVINEQLERARVTATPTPTTTAQPTQTPVVAAVSPTPAASAVKTPRATTPRRTRTPRPATPTPTPRIAKFDVGVSGRPASSVSIYQNGKLVASKPAYQTKFSLQPGRYTAVLTFKGPCGDGFEPASERRIPFVVRADGSARPTKAGDKLKAVPMCLPK